MLRRLRQSQQIETTGQSRGLCVRLTAETDAKMRASVGGFLLHDAWDVLSAVGQFVELGLTNAGHVLESDLSRDTSRLMLLAAPLLAHGLLDSASDPQGRVGFSLTDAGRSHLAGPKPRKPRGLPKFNAELAEAYDSEFAAALDERATWVPRTRGHCVVPLSAGQWPVSLDEHLAEAEG